MTFAPTDFAVVNTNDSGPGSLRQAILDNNASPSASRNTIAFNIPGPGPHVISPATALPAMTEPVLIDGYTQPAQVANTASNGFNAQIQIRLQGPASPVYNFGLTFAGSDNVVRGFSLVKFYQAIVISNANNVMEGCAVGLEESGAAGTNFAFGIFVASGGGNRIGGPTLPARNVITANKTYEIWCGLDSSNTVVEGNFIGTDFSGSAAVGASSIGVYLNGSSGNSIGGSQPGGGNLIAGHSNSGIFLNGGVSNVVQGNFIGVDVYGSAAIPNLSGIVIVASGFNIIGGTSAGERNLISGNGSSGVSIAFPGAVSNLVVGNYIGTDASGASPLPNVVGVVLAYQDNAVGGAAPGEGNLIAFNAGPGVYVSGSQTTNCAVRGNRIFANGDLGIDLLNDGVTVNDPDDTDTGPNNLQNYPVLVSGTIHPNTTDVSGTLNSRPNLIYAVDLFANVTADPSGFGEGQQFLGTTNVTTDASGNAAFSLTLPVPAVGKFLTATATDPDGNTSEFSPAFAAASTRPPLNYIVTTEIDIGPGSLRQALTDVATNPAAANNTIEFAIPGPGPHTLNIFSPLPVPAEPVTIDGFTQPGSASNTATNSDNAARQIILDGSHAGTSANGLALAQPGNLVRGLVISGFQLDGILFSGPSNVVEGCFITDNSRRGVNLDNSSWNRIGGTAPAQRNTISGNLRGGVQCLGTGASGNVLQGNLIGTDPSATVAAANNRGIIITNAPLNLVGGSEAARNYVAGNFLSGIEISGIGAVSNRVQGNYIGVLPDGVNLGNTSAGVLIASGASNNIIGEPRQAGDAGLLATFEQKLTGQRNLIAGNKQNGVSISGGANNTVSGNRIFDNEKQGIDLGDNGVTANDTGDNDSGANLLQNFPILTNATMNAGGVMVSGTLNSRNSTQYQLDFYGNLECDPSGNGQGRNFLGRAYVTTDGGGDAGFAVTLSGPALGTVITATATDPDGNTSEFSPCLPSSGSQPGGTFLVTTTADSGPGSLRQAILDADLYVGADADNIVFSFTNGSYRIILDSPLPPVIGSANIYPASTNIFMTLDGFNLQQPEAIARYGTAPLLDLRDGTFRILDQPPTETSPLAARAALAPGTGEWRRVGGRR